MRKMKKLFISLSAAALIALSGAAAYADDTEAVTEVESAAEAASQDRIAIGDEVTEDGKLSAADRASLENFATESIKMVTSLPEATIQEYLRPSSILSRPSAGAVASVQSWTDMRDELGAFVSVESHKITPADDTVTIESVCKFQNKEGVVTTTLDLNTMAMSGMTFAVNDSSLAKTLEEAALNTLMGLGIVFLTLLFLSFLISQFKHISKLEKAMEKKSEQAPAAPAPVAAAAPALAAPAAEESVDDGELVAVIAAAVAAFEGTSSDGFVVRSIKKSNRSKWQNA